MEIKIRQETSDDFKEIFELNSLAFGQENEAKLVDLLRKSEAFVPELSLVALVNDEIVGHILFTKNNIFNSTENTFTESLSLAPMAVIPEFQKIGIGGKLILKGLEIAKNIGYQSVIVLGHENYYPKFGFESAEKWNIFPPFEVPSKNFMALELCENALENVQGTVIYPKEFELV